MKFTVRDCDPDTGVPAEEGYDDEYVVSLPCTEGLTVTPCSTEWLLSRKNIFLGTSDMNLWDCFLLKHITAEEDLG